MKEKNSKCSVELSGKCDIILYKSNYPPNMMVKMVRLKILTLSVSIQCCNIANESSWSNEIKLPKQI